jgi:hypothetical protein
LLTRSNFRESRGKIQWFWTATERL